NTENSNKEELKKFIEETNEKLSSFSSILQKFGLDLITKMGQTNLKLNMLTDKIDELSKATIDVKALIPQLNNVIENQKILEAELDLIRSLIQKSSVSFQPKEIESEVVERDIAATDKKESIISQLINLKDEINKIDDPKIVIKTLKKIKEDIFVFTGGHRILYDISQIINNLNENNTIPEDLKEIIKEKTIFWKNKL
ncbi:MAG: hypothetical protein ACFFAQ_11950, partial [Promethearchaeota archaeon]